MNADNQSYNLKGEVAQLRYDMAVMKRDMQESIDQIKKDQSRKESSGQLYHLSGLMDSSMRGILPRTVMGYSYRNPRHDSFRANVSNFKKSIKEHQQLASAYAWLEGFGLFVSVFLSAFGKDMVIWWHASCLDGPSWLMFFLPSQQC